MQYSLCKGTPFKCDSYEISNKQRLNEAKQLVIYFKYLRIFSKDQIN